MKKRLALVLAGVMMVSSLAGCGSSKPAETTAAAAGETTAAAADAKADTTEAAKSDAAPELELIIASNQTSLDNPYSYGMDKFKEVVEDVSGGKIAVTVHKGTLGENENELIEKLESFKGFPQEAELPSAPKQFIQYLSEDDRPQVKADVNYENGMGVSIGRLREDSMYDYKFIGLSHNTVRGAAGGAVLCAEALTAKGYIQAK